MKENRKIKVLTVFGTRPEAIKLAPLIIRLKADKAIETLVFSTAQHRHMLEQVLDTFRIKPDFDIGVMTENQNLESIIGKVLERTGPILDQVKPDVVIVQGDTTSAFTVGLAAFFRKIKVAHVEAGLRSYDKYKPFPEEVNRRLITQVADLHFAPTRSAAENLIKEKVDKKKIYVTGNTGIDALLMVSRMRSDSAPIGLPIDSSKKLILVTAHRRESFGRPLRDICNALKKIAYSRSDVEIVYAVHLNPNVQGIVNGILKGLDRVHLIPPPSYEKFVRLMKMSYLVLTDSGGIQEEVPSLHKPVLVMRDVTERREGIKAGCARLVGVDTKNIIRNTLLLLDNERLYRKMSCVKNPYGDGKASQRIVSILKKELR